MPEILRWLRAKHDQADDNMAVRTHLSFAIAHVEMAVGLRPTSCYRRVHWIEAALAVDAAMRERQEPFRVLKDFPGDSRRVRH